MFEASSWGCHTDSEGRKDSPTTEALGELVRKNCTLTSHLRHTQKEALGVFIGQGRTCTASGLQQIRELDSHLQSRKK